MAAPKLDENGLSIKDRLFISNYLVTRHVGKAAAAAGYSERSAAGIGSRMLGRPEIKAEIQKRAKTLLRRVELTAELVLDNIRRPLAADPADLYDENGNPRPLHELSVEARSLIAAIETPPYNADGSDGKTNGRMHRYKLVDRSRYVEMAAKHFKLLTDNVQHSGSINFTWQRPEEVKPEPVPVQVIEVESRRTDEDEAVSIG